MTTAEILMAVGRAMLGELDVIGFHDGHGGTVVMRAHSNDHGEVIVKVHRSLQRHGQETHAYRHWVRALDWRVPRLIAVNANPAAIAITAISGQPLDTLSLPPGAERDAHRQAGAILRTLHVAWPCARDPGFTTFLAERGRYWISQAGARLDCVQRRDLEGRLEQLVRLRVDTLTPCHLDFMPRNLVRDHDGTIRVIDFEHARYDLPARDLVRMATRIWPQRPDLETAFRDGYGDLSDLDRLVIDCCAAIDIASRAATDLRWASARHSDPSPSQQLGRRVVLTDVKADGGSG
ncbi:aminoglycoside phosphotransferase family protein [Allorhizocola rhizosphaerae]|uniref:aminoglycoside phosphotransferase family protein n=1 Tax=Allorhizocola rhizosphaerae TaxID=1872709 RepID=UPI001FE5A01B|nr:aminoglycoside phosphotransferase family protein [Allorhizocola rhizosphaerae]